MSRFLCFFIAAAGVAASLTVKGTATQPAAPPSRRTRKGNRTHADA